mgnify:CR=1 FL=1
MPGTTDTVKAILTPGEFVIRKEAVDMIGAPILEKINDMPETGGHSSIDRLIQMATMSNMKAMYGGGMVNAGPKPMQMGGMAEEYGHGGMVKDKMMMMAKGGQLKPVPEDNPGLAKLPEKVRNRMGYMQDGGKVMSEKSMMDFFMRDFKDPRKKELKSSVMSGKVKPRDALQMLLNMQTADYLRSTGDTTNVLFDRLKEAGYQDGGMVEDNLMGMMGGGMMKKPMSSYQDGGMIGPPAPPMDDPLQIGMRQASPEMYAGQTLGGMSEEEALEQGIMQSQMMKNQAIEDSAMQSLQLLRLRAMMADSSMAEPSSESKMEMMMSDPSMQQFLNGVSLDSLINAQMQSGGMQMQTVNRDMGEMLKMEMMKRGREALMRGMVREGQEDPLEALR